MLKYNKFVVTENQLLCRMLFYKCSNIIPIVPIIDKVEHAFEGAHLHQDKYTGKLPHNINNIKTTDYFWKTSTILEGSYCPHVTTNRSICLNVRTGMHH